MRPSLKGENLAMALFLSCLRRFQLLFLKLQLTRHLVHEWAGTTIISNQPSLGLKSLWVQFTCEYLDILWSKIAYHPIDIAFKGI